MIYNKDEFLQFVKCLKNTKVLYDKNNIVILRVKTYNDCKALFGNDKTINWCIANSRCHWDEYIGNHSFTKQYFIIDFNHVNDKPMIEGYGNREYIYSMIGFTTRFFVWNLTAAHARNDKNLLEETYGGNNDKILLFKRILKEKGIHKFVAAGFRDCSFLENNFVAIFILTLMILYSLVVWFFKWH